MAREANPRVMADDDTDPGKTSTVQLNAPVPPEISDRLKRAFPDTSGNAERVRRAIWIALEVVESEEYHHVAKAPANDK